MNLKRLQKEIRSLSKDPLPDCIALPFEDDITQWRFIFKGADDTDYRGGLYMGSIILPDKYPFAPPRILMNTPNGRFRADGKSICMSFSDWHPESWNPAWGIRTIILGLISFFYETRNTNGALKTTAIEKSRLAEQSIDYNRRCLDYQRLFRNNTLELALKPPKTVVIKRKRVKIAFEL